MDCFANTASRCGEGYFDRRNQGLLGERNGDDAPNEIVVKGRIAAFICPKSQLYGHLAKKSRPI
jgi:hypothetical protein